MKHPLQSTPTSKTRERRGMAKPSRNSFKRIAVDFETRYDLQGTVTGRQTNRFNIQTTLTKLLKGAQYI